ncbi:FAD binding domain-containing protein, partial [Dichotomocladium elegans]
DAAHCHSPVGGQGMNLGLQDAENLAWKLSLVLRGISSNSDLLLDSYGAEREPIAAATLKTTGTMTRYGFNNSFIISTLTYYAVAIALSFEKVQARAVTTMMQVPNMCIATESPLLLASSEHLIQPGAYLPETITLRRRFIGELERKTLRQILAGPTPNHAVVFVCARPSRFDPCRLVSDFWRLVREMGPRNARPVVIESTWHVHHNSIPAFATADDKDAFWTEDHWDAEHSVTKRIGLDKFLNEMPVPPSALVVIRPDLYVTQATLIRSQNDIKLALASLGTYLI